MPQKSPARPGHRITCLLAVFTLVSATVVRADLAELQLKYNEISAALNHNVYGLPVYIQSQEYPHTMLGEIYGIIPQAFNMVQDALTTPAAWCEIVPQHLNIKACTCQQTGNSYQLTVYAGRKFYQKAEDVYELDYRFEPSRSEKDYFRVSLIADEGPMGTRDYHIEVEAIPLDASQTFIHFRYSYRYNFVTTMGMKIYLATMGRDKVGFSVTGSDEAGKPEYVAGIRGIIERNAIRYYFAIMAHLDTLQIEPDERFNARLDRWFDLTEKYPLQLHELDRKDYLQYKQQEHLDQLRLQQTLDHIGARN